MRLSNMTALAEADALDGVDLKVVEDPK